MVKLGQAGRLERLGLIRRPLAAPRTVISSAAPRPKDGRKASDLVIQERRSDRWRAETSPTWPWSGS